MGAPTSGGSRASAHPENLRNTVARDRGRKGGFDLGHGVRASLKSPNAPFVPGFPQSSARRSSGSSDKCRTRVGMERRREAHLEQFWAQ